MGNDSSLSYLHEKATYIKLFDALSGHNLLLEANPPFFTILAATPQRLQDVGMKKEAVVGKALFKAHPGNSSDPLDNGVANLHASLDHVLRYKEVHALPVQRYDLPDGQGGFSQKYWRASNRPVLNEAGEVAYIIHTAEEITHEIKAHRQEERLKFTEQTYSLFMQVPLAIHIVTGPELIIDMANPLTLELWGKEESVIGKRLLDVLPELKGQGYDVMMQEVMATGQPRHSYEVALALNRPEKKPTGYFNFIYQPYYKEGRTPAESVLIIASDVTEQVLAQKQASGNEQSLSLAVEIAELGIFTIDLKTALATCSHQVMDWFGFQKPLLPMKDVFARIHAEDQAMATETIERSIAGEWDGRHDFVYRVLHPETGRLHYLRSIGQVQYENGTPVSISGIIQDVTKEVTATRKIKESESRFRSLIEEAPIATCLFVGREMVIEVANEAMIEVWGKGKGVIGKPLSEALPELKGQHFLPLLDELFATGNSYSTKGGRADLVVAGKLQTFYFDYDFKPLRNADGTITAILETAVDVTAEVLAKKALETSESRLRDVILRAPVAMCIFRGLQFVIEIANAKMFEFWGKTSDEVMGKPLFIAIPEAVNQGYEELMTAVLTTGETFSANELPVTLPRNGVVQTVFINFTYEPFREPDGTISGILAVAIDVTEGVVARHKIEDVVQQRTKELAQANEALSLSNLELNRSNEQLEEFAHAASHDLKEPVRKIHFFTSQLKSQLRDRIKENEVRFFDRIENATERMGNLIDDLLLYSHVSQRPHEREAVDLNEKIQRVLEDLELDIQEKGAVVKVGNLPVLQGYRRQLQQLFQNLISNALKYSKAEVPPRIEIAAQLKNKEGRVYHFLTVTDNGIGFEPQYADKIFQMFTRLHGKAEYSGTGVGLAIVKKVVENHHGFIGVESEPGKGSMFKIYLPV